MNTLLDRLDSNDIYGSDLFADDLAYIDGLVEAPDSPAALISEGVVASTGSAALDEMIIWVADVQQDPAFADELPADHDSMI
jgi:hypothetical protein